MKRLLSLFLVMILTVTMSQYPVGAEVSERTKIAEEQQYSENTEDSDQDINPDQEEEKERIEFTITGEGICTITAVGFEIPEDAGVCRLAFWSTENGQDDLQWYLQKEIDAGYQTEVDLSRHGRKNGEYNLHLYYADAKNRMICYSRQKILIEDMVDPIDGTDPVKPEDPDQPVLPVDPDETVEPVEPPVVEKGYTEEVFLDETTCQLRAVNYMALEHASDIRASVWSAADGQDDIRWYSLTETDDASGAKVWTAVVDLQEHGGENGSYYVHYYYKNEKGKAVCFSTASILLELVPKDECQATFTRADGNFDISYRCGAGNEAIKKVKAAVWQDAGQADLKWYTMSLAEDGSWKYSGNIRNHGYRTGDYKVHIYVTDLSGTMSYKTATGFSAAEQGKLTINAVTKNEKYRAVIDDFDASDVKSVKVAVWSAAEGQDDLRWYTASKSGSRYVADIPITNHNSVGKYYAHAYITRIDDVQYSMDELKKTFQVEADVTAAFSFCSRLTDNGTFSVIADVKSNIPVKTVTFYVWNRERGEESKETLTADLLDDSSWSVVVNTGHHGYLLGEYVIECRVTLSDGTTVSTDETGFTCTVDKGLFTVVNSEESATVVVNGYSDAKKVKVAVWSINGGQDDLRYYTGVRNDKGWQMEILKKNHGSAGYYRVDLYVDDVYQATDQFTFDANRYGDSLYAVSIAHAAGGQGSGKEDIYTNCLSAMSNSYSLGYRTFEIDVLLTSDNKPVLFHTWNTTPILDHYTYSSSTANGPTYSEFMNDTMYGGKYKTADFGNLLDYLTRHPDVKVLLDTKYRSDSDMKKLYKILKEEAVKKNALSVFQKQVVPYFFTTGNYSAINSVLSFGEYHYATYASFPKKIGTFSTDSFKSVLQFCKMNRVLSVSMWDCLATHDLIKLADSYGILVYVHTTDDAATAERMLKMGAAGIIGNKITPVQAIGYVS